MFAVLPTPQPGREAYALNLAAAAYWRMFPHGVGAPLDGGDLWGAALLGAAKALARWDPAGARFEVFAIGRIRAEIIEEMRTQGRQRAGECPPGREEAAGAFSEALTRLLWQSLLDRLPAREAEVVRRMFYRGETAVEVAQDWKRHPTRVRQLKQQALARLRGWVEEE